MGTAMNQYKDRLTGGTTNQNGSDGAAHVKKVMSDAAFASGVLPGTAAVPVAMAGAPLPATVVLNSIAAGRKIEVSCDGGTTYFTPDYSFPGTSTAQIILSIGITVTHVAFTGQANDTYSIR